MDTIESILDEFPQLVDGTAVAEFDFDMCFTRNNADRAFSDLDVAMALLRAAGNVAKAAEHLGRPRRAVANYIYRNVRLRDLQEDLWDTFLDEIEGKHMDLALAGDATVQRFFLVTRGKDRGYSTRSETTGKNGEPLEGNFKVTPDMPSDLLEQLLAHRDAAT